MVVVQLSLFLAITKHTFDRSRTYNRISLKDLTQGKLDYYKKNQTNARESPHKQCLCSLCFHTGTLCVGIIKISACQSWALLGSEYEIAACLQLFKALKNVSHYFGNLCNMSFLLNQLNITHWPPKFREKCSLTFILFPRTQYSILLNDQIYFFCYTKHTLRPGRSGRLSAFSSPG